jgi:hypothetical protein
MMRECQNDAQPSFKVFVCICGTKYSISSWIIAITSRCQSWSEGELRMM